MRLKLSNFSPLQYSPRLWLDAADSSTITLALGTSISQWDDKSGNDNHATQTVASNQMTYDENGIGTSTTVHGTTNQYMDITITDGIPNDNTIFLVNKLNVSMLRYYLFSDIDNYYVGIRDRDGDGLVYQHNNPFITLTYPNFGSHDIITYVSDYTNLNFGAYSTGNTLTTPDTLPNVMSGSVNTNFKLNARSTIPFFSPDADYTELLVFPYAMSDNKRKVVEGYLAWEWDLVASLPVDHPFKAKAP